MKIWFSAISLLASVSWAQDIKLTPDHYKYSPNSITGVYVCTPLHVERGECRAVDKEYYENLALLTLGIYEIGILTVNQEKTVAFKGPLSMGAADYLIEIFKKHPDVKTLILSSQGGSEEEAYKIADYVAQNQIRTWVPAKRMCLSACVAIFLSGSEWILDGQLGLHSASFFIGDIVRVRDLQEAGFILDKVLYNNSKTFLRRARELSKAGVSWASIERAIMAKGKFLDGQVEDILKQTTVPLSQAQLQKIRPTIEDAIFQNNLFLIKRIRQFESKGLSYDLIPAMIEARGDFLVFTSIENLIQYKNGENYVRPTSEMVQYSKDQELVNFDVQDYQQLF